jgi:CheY-like chemotaxis protein
MSLTATTRAGSQVEPAKEAPVRISQIPELLVITNARDRGLAALEASGQKQTTVADIPSALVQLRRGAPLMTLLDAEIALKTSSDLLCLLRTHPAQGQRPLVLMGAESAPAEALELMHAVGLDDFLFKPLEVGTLKARLQRGQTPLPLKTEGRRAYKTLLAVGEWTGRSALCEALTRGGLWVKTSSQLEAQPFPYDLDAILLVLTPFKELEALVAQLRKSAGAERPPPLTFWLPKEGETGLCPPKGVTRVSPAAASDPDVALMELNTYFDRPLMHLLLSRRVPFLCPVRFRETGTPMEWQCCYSFEISPAGIFLKTLVPARPGSCVDLRIHLPTSHEVLEGGGVVAWATPPPRVGFGAVGGMGVEFLGMSPTELRRLSRVYGEAAESYRRR